MTIGADFFTPIGLDDERADGRQYDRNRGADKNFFDRKPTEGLEKKLLDVEDDDGGNGDRNQKERDVERLSDVAEQLLSVDEIIDSDEVEVGMKFLPEQKLSDGDEDDRKVEDESRDRDRASDVEQTEQRDRSNKK